MINRRVRKSAVARADVDRIADWIFERSGSVDATLKWLADLEERFHSIAEAPGTGTARPEIGPTVRSSPFGNYLVLFRATKRTVIVLRVLHGARDFRGGMRLE